MFACLLTFVALHHYQVTTNIGTAPGVGGKPITSFTQAYQFPESVAAEFSNAAYAESEAGDLTSLSFTVQVVFKPTSLPTTGKYAHLCNVAFSFFVYVFVPPAPVGLPS